MEASTNTFQNQDEFSNVKYSQVNLGFVNWSTTCNIKMANMRVQSHMSGYMAMDSPNTMGMVLETIFGHQKGFTYMAQHQALRLLADQNLLVGHTFTLQFDVRPDQREGKPNNYPGRLAHDTRVKDWDLKFKNSCASGGRTLQRC